MENGCHSTPHLKNNNLCEAEIEFFNEYCSSLAEFQAGIGENGVNLLLSTHPPKALYVQVRVLENYGEFETSDGNLVMLQVNSTQLISVGFNACQGVDLTEFNEL
ncbi:hypothetical protein TELCIR_05665 [Teladorsagia circumcincta]|uniref:DNA replication complex GINS protein PSF1 n=1 Tax=Teladorsagia circumcincta TaxID=45464 RepID=A0A2G9UQD0_TELCI|nr:hypothetical protein TELCIR_05665 [Teladorsagia circumcincta]